MHTIQFLTENSLASNSSRLHLSVSKLTNIREHICFISWSIILRNPVPLCDTNFYTISLHVSNNISIVVITQMKSKLNL